MNVMPQVTATSNLSADEKAAAYAGFVREFKNRSAFILN